MINEIKKMYPLVKEILEKYPVTRDNYHILLLEIWARQKPSLTDPDTPFRSGFAREFANGEFASVLSVTRARRKVQEEHPHLRGSTYKVRKVLANDVRDGI